MLKEVKGGRCAILYSLAKFTVLRELEIPDMAVVGFEQDGSAPENRSLSLTHRAQLPATDLR